MRAVNLISDGSRRSGASSGSAAYALLGVLAVLVAGSAYYVLTSNTIADHRAKLAALSTQAQAAQSQADQLGPYSEFASLASARVQTVRQLGAARFDWERAFKGLAKVVPGNVWLTSLLGTVTSGVSVEGASSGGTSTLRGVLPNPAIELTGCTTTHDNVVRLVSRLRLMHGVVRVALADSIKGDASAGAGGGSGSDSGDCRHGHANFPQFDVVIFFDPLPAAPTAPGSAATGGTATASAATAGTTTTPTTTSTTPATGAAPAPASSQPAGSTTPAPTGAPSNGSAAR